MLKRLGVLTIAVVIVSFYAYGQTQKEEQAGNGQNPSHRVSDAPVEQNNGESLQPKGQQHVDADVKVIALPAKDWQDIATFWITVILAAVGMGTLFYLKRQANIMEGQLREMESQRQQTVAQIQMMKDKERARLIMSLRPLTEIETDFFLPQEVSAKVKNIGYSHAFNVRFEYRCEITNSAAEPSITSRSSEHLEIIRAGGKPEPISFSITADNEMWDKAIVPGAKNLFVHLWGKANFENGFGNPGSLGFHYIFDIRRLDDVNGSTGLAVDALSRMREWGKCPLPECNQET